MTALFCALLLDVAATQDAFRRANEDYLHGRLEEAARGYERLVAEGARGAAVWYNLGNVYYRLDRLGPAVHAYERARAFEPEAADVAFNLKLARAEAARHVRERIEGADEPSLRERLATAARGRTLALAFLACWTLLFAGLVAARLLRGVARAAVGATSAMLGIATLLLGAWLGLRAWHDATVVGGIVLPDRVEAREGPDPTYRGTFALHAGLAVRIVERDGDFVKVRLANGLEGWVAEKDVGTL